MDQRMNEHRVADVATLEALYGHPSGAAVEKELDYIHPHYRSIISTAPGLLERFSVGGRLPRSVVVVSVDTVFFRCSRTVWRAKVWETGSRIDARACRARERSSATSVSPVSTRRNTRTGCTSD
jgi:predicted pyridoxine 5'-phosphate oxidase superfamily flavin-nucleotide-binding protein